MRSLLKYKATSSKAEHVLIYGAPKVGKTRKMGELAKKFNLLWIDLENGVSTLMDSCTDEQLDKIEYIRIPDSTINPIACETLLKMFESTTPGYICTDHGVWCCDLCAKQKDTFFKINLKELTPANNWVIVIDSGTQFALSSFHKVCNKNNISLESGEKTSFTIWGMQGVYIDKLFSMMQISNNHVIVSGHEIEVDMPDKSKKIAPSIGTRKVAANFGKYFDHVIRATKDAGGYKLSCDPIKSFSCEVGSRWSLNAQTADIADFFIKPAKVESTNAPVAATPLQAGNPMNAALARLKKR
jgi:hypothetical protein